MPRQQVSSPRSTASNRLAIQDMKSSLSFNGSSSYATSTLTPSNSGFCFGMWVKVNKVTTNDRVLDWADGGPANGFGLNMTATKQYNMVITGSGSIQATQEIPVGKWQHVVVTYAPDNMKFYLDGVSVGTDTSTTMTTATQTLTIGRRSASAANYFNGLMSGFVFQNTTTPWTQAQISALMQGTIPSGATQVLPLNEGAGTTAYDSSGNGNNGTITSGTYVLDTPTKIRKQVNGNLVYNGDFEYAPPFTAATTTNQRWIDGTAAGSTTNNLFGWSIGTSTGSVAASYDSANGYTGTYSLKISTTATASFIEAHQAQIDSTASRIANRSRIIVMLPSTAYTATYRMKTNLVSGTATNGAQIQFRELDGSMAVVTTNSGTVVKTSSEWTLYTVSFTTNASTRFINIVPLVYGHQGTATLIMDAWFDDITLTKTTPEARTVVS